jgi:hypothetical protein
VDPSPNPPDPENLRASCKAGWEYRVSGLVHLFFTWIKQHLRIKAFRGYSENAVKTQIWIAVSVYVLVAILKKRLALEASLHEILQVLSVTFFEQVPILQAFHDVDSKKNRPYFPTS